MLRITGGTNRSRLLETPDTSLTKPTMDKVRGAVFSALGEKTSNSEVLDLFAGSGSYGFEALSRGASHVTFVDKLSLAIKCIKKNGENLKHENISIINEDVMSFINEETKKYDIVFIDPPYKLEVYSDIVKTLISRELIKDNGIIVLESERELDIDSKPFKEVRFYKYGLAKIYILRK